MKQNIKRRKVKLGQPSRDVKKSKVFVRNEKGKVVKVNFGDKNMTIKKIFQREEKIISKLATTATTMDHAQKQGTGVVKLKREKNA